MSIADPSLSGGDIARNFTMGILGSIQQQASSNVADFISGSLFGDLFKKKDNQSGGIIGAQNGMYISGSGTGDKYPALLENKEYVLNRKAVEALGGPAALDVINFGIAPRFAYGGVFGGVRSKARNRAVEKFGWASMGPTSGGSALGGGGMSLGLDYFDSRLSSRGRDDPTARAIKGYFREDHQKQIAKKFQKQANEDALKQAVVGAAVNAGLSYGVGKLGAHMENSKLNKQALADESEVFGGDFDFSPLHTAPYGKGTGGGGTGGGGGSALGGGTTFTSSVVQPAIPSSFPGDPRLGNLGSAIGSAIVNTAGDKGRINAARVAAGNAAATAEIARTQAKQAQDIVKQKEYTERDLEQRRAYMAAASNLEKVNEQGNALMKLTDAISPIGDRNESGRDWNAESLMEQFEKKTGVPRGTQSRKQLADYLYKLSEQFGGGRPAPPPPKAKTTVGAPDMVGKTSGISLGSLGAAVGRAPSAIGGVLSAGFGALGKMNRDMYNKLNPAIPRPDSNDNRITRAMDSVYSSSQGYIGEKDGKFYVLEQHKSGQWGHSPTPLFMNKSTLMKSLDGRKIPGYQRGGSIDNIPAMLTGGEFVMNAGAVRKYGSATLGNMNRFQTGGIVGPQKFVPGEEGGSGGGKQKPAESSTNNNTVNISVNMGNGGGGANVTEDAVGTNLNTANGGRELGTKIKKAVLQVIEEEKRVGGRLRNPYAKDQ